ncbi:UNVERIFIED_ORG: membrane fusion protein [Stenotrophomonas maltophilia]
MADGFFREEVFKARRDGWLGTVHLQPPRFGRVAAALAISVVIAIAILLVMGSYTRHEKVSGTLVPQGGILSVLPPAGGRVIQLLVDEGQAFKAGQPLLELSSELDSVGLGATQAATIQQLSIKRERLKADLSGNTQLADLRQQELGRQILLLEQQSLRLSEQISLQRRRVDASTGLYESWERHRDSGVVSKVQLLQQEDAATQNLAALRELERQALELAGQRIKLVADRDQIPLNLQNQINEIDRQTADVAQALSESEARRAQFVRAPVDGTVGNLHVHAGQSVDVQQPLLTILPKGTSLQAELWVSSKAVGFIKPGDAVVIRYEAFPYQKFGRFKGVITEISRSAVDSAQLSRMIGSEVKEQRYRVLVRLQNQSVTAYGKPVYLLPGMALEADVLLDRRSLLEWLIAPLQGMALDIGMGHGNPERIG